MAEKNYWIKDGMVVRNKHWPNIKMVVDNVKKRTKPVTNDEHTSDGADLVRSVKTFTIGVNTHWIDENGNYQKGMFHTTELEPWPEQT